jgi:hypothetical protein
MPHTTHTEPNQDKSSFKWMLLALATAFIGILQALLRKPFRR